MDVAWKTEEAAEAEAVGRVWELIAAAWIHSLLTGETINVGRLHFGHV